MSSLKLTLKKEWFDKIATGEKKTEYREIKKYWIVRIENKEFSEIHFKNGYKPDSPFLRIEYLGYEKTKNEYYPNGCFALKLGKIIEIKI